jgi:8-oxo-dGTP pyrophosphatase MutT (NUDIX family)
MSHSSKTIAAKRVQYGALPYRLSAGSRPQFMLITSRETRRWVIPKGWPKKGKSPQYSAAREAFEEAGSSARLPSAPLAHSHMKSE